jgi:hypothetical protein
MATGWWMKLGTIHFSGAQVVRTLSVTRDPGLSLNNVLIAT